MSDSPQRPSPFTRPGFIAAAVVVVLIVVGGGIAIFAGLTSTADPDPAPTSGTSSPAPSAADESLCGLEGFETESSLTEAPDNEWELVGTVAAPTDPQVGPGVVDDGFRSCYVHTAEGALFAAVNYVAMGSDPRLQPRLWELLEDGPFKDQAEAEARGASPAPSSSRLQVAGFKVLSYAADRAVIDVAWQVTSPTTGLMSAPIEFVWQHGDWHIATTETGLPYSPAQLQSLGGYIPWSGA